MENPEFSRRDILRGSVAMAAYALAARPMRALGLDAGPDEQLLPFLDVQPVGKMLYWQNLTSWITPTSQLYEVKHYGFPTVPVENWKITFTGLVKRPQTLSLDQLKRRRKKTLVATLECGGNGSSPGFMGAVGNARWTGTPLAPILRDLGLTARSKEVVFYGADEKIEKIRDKDYPQNFARSLSIDHALMDHILLAWELNGEPLDQTHGAPVRLVVPGWFGIAWVKWLKRVDILDRRFMGRWMARDYVTIRGDEDSTDWTNWRETSVSNLCVKSIAARAVRRPNGSIRVSGAAWSDGTPLEKVEVRIDDGPWQRCELEKKPTGSKYTWTFWRYDWPLPTSGEHTVVSRATDADGRVQPSPEDPAIKNKKTYWEANQQWPRRIRV